MLKEIDGFPGYFVSDEGKVYSTKNKKGELRERVLQVNKHRRGYVEVSLYRENCEKRFKVHKLVAAAFIPNPQNKMEINHKDGDKRNNAAVNLEWCTSKENKAHAFATGLMSGRHRWIPVLCVETGELFKSFAACAGHIGAHRSDLFKAVKNGTALKGMHFKRARELYIDTTGHKGL